MDHWPDNPDVPSYYYSDVIEDDALNEISCIQVLKSLISKADEDIAELEQDISHLNKIHQLQLTVAAEKWTELCFDTLRGKIRRLENSIQRLKNVQIEENSGARSQSESHGRPYGRKEILLNDLLKVYIELKASQNSRSNDEEHLKEESKSSAFDSGVTHTRAQEPSTSDHGKKEDAVEKHEEPPLIVNVEDSNSDAEELETGAKIEERKKQKTDHLFKP